MKFNAVKAMLIVSLVIILLYVLGLFLPIIKNTKETKKGEILIWLDNEDGTPMGVIVKKTKVEEIRGRKRIRQGKKKE